MSNSTYSVTANKNPPLARNRVGTAAENAAFTGVQGEISIVSSANTLRLHDGSTAGGSPLSLSTGASVTNATIVSSTINGTNTITCSTGSMVVNETAITSTATSLAANLRLTIVLSTGSVGYIPVASVAW